MAKSIISIFIDSPAYTQILADARVTAALSGGRPHRGSTLFDLVMVNVVSVKNGVGYGRMDAHRRLERVGDRVHP